MFMFGGQPNVCDALSLCLLLLCTTRRSKRLLHTNARPQNTLMELKALIVISSRAIGVDCPISGQFKLSMIKREGEAPRLRLKAAKTRHFVPVLRHLLETFFRPATDHEQLRHQMIVQLDECYKLTKNWDHVPNAAVALECFSRRHVLLYAELAHRHLSTLGDGGKWLRWRICRSCW